MSCTLSFPKQEGGKFSLCMRRRQAGKGWGGGEEERQEIVFTCLSPQNTAEENFHSRDLGVILP